MNERNVRCLTYTADEVAVILGISRQSVYRRAETGEIPNRKLGRRLIFPQREILELVTSPAANKEDTGWMEKSSDAPAATGPRPIRNG